MDYSLKKMLGLLDEGKRQYRFVSGEVTKDEYDYCRTIDQLLFGKGGYVETLGPTWEMIHDPRFSKIENTFIVNRRAIFGGSAQTGKQYISSDGQYTSQISDLENYSEVLGEGRYFFYVLTHPDESCQLRNWYLRIFPEMMSKQGKTVPEPSDELVCTCKEEVSAEVSDPFTFKDAPDSTLWAIIQQECPNYFTKEGKPNAIATRLFDLFRADLLGLIGEFSLTPISDVFVELDTGDVIKSIEEHENPEASPRVFLEVDILEKALTQRAVLRATAAKVLRQIDFQKVIKQELGGDVRLTDLERDEVLRLVYNTTIQDVAPQTGLSVSFASDLPDANWNGFLFSIKEAVTKYIKDIKATGKKAKQREEEQLSRASQKAQDTFVGLRTGSMQSINQFTEPEVEIELDPHAEIMQAILKNPLKQELFIIWVEAERRSNEDEDDRLSMHQLYSILTPIFTDPEFLVTGDEYVQYMDKATELGFFTEPQTSTVEEVLGDLA